MERISFVVVVVGGDCIEVCQCWEAEASRKCDFIADAVAAFCSKHGVVIDRVLIRPIN